MHARHNRAGFWARLFGLPALVLALACQVALGAADLPDQPTDARSLQTIGVMCRSHPAPNHAPRHRHAAPACCTLAAAFGHAGLMPVAPVSVPAPVMIVESSIAVPPARAPPAAARSVAYPRGPPCLT